MNCGNELLKILSGVPLGIIIEYVVGVSLILMSVIYVVLRLYRIFNRYNNFKKDSEQYRKRIDEHEQLLHEIFDTIKDIDHKLDKQTEVNRKQVRHTVVRAADEAIHNGNISASAYKSLHEMYSEYRILFGPNTYVHKMIEHVDKLPIIGTLDDLDV